MKLTKKYLRFMLFSTYVRLCAVMCIYGCGGGFYYYYYYFLALRFEYSISDMLPTKKKKRLL